mgnify:CR=1 FL=1
MESGKNNEILWLFGFIILTKNMNIPCQMIIQDWNMVPPLDLLIYPSKASSGSIGSYYTATIMPSTDWIFFLLLATPDGGGGGCFGHITFISGSNYCFSTKFGLLTEI